MNFVIKNQAAKKNDNGAETMPHRLILNLHKAEQLSLFGGAHAAPSAPEKKKKATKQTSLPMHKPPGGIKIKISGASGAKRGKGMIGEIREWKDGRYQKQADGEWKKIGEAHHEQHPRKTEKPKSDHPAAGVLGDERRREGDDRSADPGAASHTQAATPAKESEIAPPKRKRGRPKKVVSEETVKAAEIVKEAAAQILEDNAELVPQPVVLNATQLLEIEGPPQAIYAEFPSGEPTSEIRPTDPVLQRHRDLLPEIDPSAKLKPDVIKFPHPAPLKDKEGKISGYIEKLTQHQIEGTERVLTAWKNADGFILEDDAGLGKYLPMNTLICTPDGWRRNGDLQVGDFVTGSNGQKTRVKGVYPQGVKSIYRVTFSDHSSVEAGAEHLWTVAYWAGGRRMQELTLTTEQLQKRPTIDIEWPNGRKTQLSLKGVRLYLPMLSAPVEFASERVSETTLPIQPYVLGQCLANGALTNGTASLSTNAHDWAETKKLLIRSGVSIGSSHPYGNTTKSTILGIIGKLKELDLDVLSGEKFIPDIYQMARVSERIDLLHGLMDADGSVSESRNRLIYHSTSEMLACGVQQLVEGLGGIASVRPYDRTEEGKPIEFQVRIRLPLGILPFTVERKARRYNPGRFALPTRTVESVEYTRDTEAQCIAVEAEDRLYVTEHCILTHNTNIALAAIKAHGGKRNLIVVPRQGKEGLKRQWKGERAAGLYGMKIKDVDEISATEDGTYIVSYDEFIEAQKGKKQLILKDEFLNGEWDTIVFDESHTMAGHGIYSESAKLVARKAKKALYMSATPFTNVKDMHYLTRMGLFGDGEQKFADWAEMAGAFVKRTKDGRISAIKNPSSPYPMYAIAATLHVDGLAIKREATLEGMSSEFGYTERSKLDHDAMKTFGVVNEIMEYNKNMGCIPETIAEMLYTSWNRKYWETLKIDQAIDLGKKALSEGKQVAFFTSFRSAGHKHIIAFQTMCYKKAMRAEAKGDAKGMATAQRYYNFANVFQEYLDRIPPPRNPVDVLAQEFGGSKAVAEIHGGTRKKPADEQDAYQNGKKKVCVATMSRGGTGISLHDTSGDAPRVQINLSLPWSGREFLQVAGRSHRLGSKSDTTMHWLIGDDANEKKNGAIVARRLRSLGSLTAGDPNMAVDSAHLAAWEFTDTQMEDDNEDALIAAAEEMMEEMDSGDGEQPEAKDVEASAKEETKDAEAYFREYAMARREGRDVLKERYEANKLAKAKEAEREAKRAAEQLRQHMKWRISFDDRLNVYRIMASDVHTWHNVHLKAKKVGGKFRWAHDYKSEFHVPISGMTELSRRMKANEIKVDLRDVVAKETEEQRIKAIEAEAKTEEAKKQLEAAGDDPVARSVVRLNNKHGIIVQQRGDEYLLMGDTYKHRDKIKPLARGIYEYGKFVGWSVKALNMPLVIENIEGKGSHVSEERKAAASDPNAGKPRGGGYYGKYRRRY